MNDSALGSIPINDIQLGMTVRYSQTITDADIKAYAGISGDHNPVHVDSDYANSSRFGKRIAHGLMSAGFFSALFGTKLPGPGCVYVAQSLNFKRPVYIDDTVTATITVTKVELNTNRVFFDTVCTVRGKEVITGCAEIYIPKEKPRPQ
ncbi:MaoC family dehydratase [Pseudomonas fildesensis]|uniref:Acyl dehydratase n=1 Tax=Pseudomonas fildesensis TaxID=1674920 RepID=A0A0J8FUZ7_9PSED|nr:MaoC family dehydratase [Pseudomonas fildesensis]KMT52519.1 acyl dehydratase [Pseudomonas fildesensis]